MKKINVTQLRTIAPTLKAGDEILLSGVIYTARDAAHKRIIAQINNKSPLPFDINGAVIYYAGPTPEKNGLAVGSCGPTTSSRMDVYAPILYDLGLYATIGKGARNAKVVEAIVNNKGLYLCAIGGAGALASKCIKKCDVVAFEDLGCESVKRMEIQDFPLYVGIDTNGNSIFAEVK